MSSADAASCLKRVIYLSAKNENYTHNDWNAQIRDILAHSRVSNAGFGLTGALLTDDVNFVQVLEGPADGLSIVLPKIVADPRHTIIRIEESITQQRQFEEWSMAFMQLSEPSVTVLGPMRDFARAAPASSVITMMQHLIFG